MFWAFLLSVYFGEKEIYPKFLNFSCACCDGFSAAVVGCPKTVSGKNKKCQKKQFKIIGKRLNDTADQMALKCFYI